MPNISQTITFQIVASKRSNGTTHRCLSIRPLQCRIKAGVTSQIILLPDASNHDPVTVFFEDDEVTNALFSPAPPSEVNLLPATVQGGAQLEPPAVHELVLTINPDLDPDIVPTYEFDTDPAERCGSGDHTSVIVEC